MSSLLDQKLDLSFLLETGWLSFGVLSGMI